MILRGGVFGRGLGAMGAQDLFLTLDPKAGKGVPFTQMLQGVIKQRGAPNLAVDGQWGRCSHSAFTKTFGTPPSYDSLNTLFGLKEFGVPESNVSVWKPGALDVCWNGTDKYQAPTLDQQLSAPDPKLQFASLFGLAAPAAVCSGGKLLSTTTQKCECPPGTFENVTTGMCDALETPGKIGPTPVVTKTPTTQKYFSIAPATTTTTTDKNLVVPKATRVARPVTNVASAVQTTSMMTAADMIKQAAAAKLLADQQLASSGMSAGAKLFIGVVVLAGLGGVGWWATHRKKATPNRRRRRGRRSRRWRCNCGE